MECNLTTLGISFGKLDRRGFLRGRKRGVDVAVPRHWALGGCGVGVGAQVSLLSGLLLLRSCGLGHEWLRWGCWPSPRRTLSSPRTNKVSSQNQGARRGDVCLRVRDSEGRQEGNSGPRGGKRMREGGGDRDRPLYLGKQTGEARQLNGSHTVTNPNLATRLRVSGNQETRRLSLCGRQTGDDALAGAEPVCQHEWELTATPLGLH